MAALFSYISTLSPAGLLLHAALVLMAFLLIVILLPNKKSAATSTAKANKNNRRKHSPAANKDTPKNKAPQPTTVYVSSGKRHWFWPFGRKKIEITPPSPPADPNKLNQTLDFLNPDPEKERKYFKHPTATDSYRELIRPGAVMSESIPDLDETDKIFSTMLRAGAIKGRLHLVTNYEHHYLEKLRIWFGEHYHIYCQVSVGSAVQINADVSELNMPQRRTFAQKCNNMSFDFMLIDKATDRIVCAIELDDPTHQRIERKLRDRRLDRVCREANIPIFHITNVYQKPDLSRIRL